MSNLRQQIQQKLEGMAQENGVRDPAPHDLRRVEPRTYGRTTRDSSSPSGDEWRRPSARPAISPPKKVTVPVPKEARDLEGRYGDAPDRFNRRTGIGPATVRICILAVEWHTRLGSTEQVLRVTGRDVRTKNIVVCNTTDLCNIGDDP